MLWEWLILWIPAQKLNCAPALTDSASSNGWVGCKSELESKYRTWHTDRRATHIWSAVPCCNSLLAPSLEHFISSFQTAGTWEKSCISLAKQSLDFFPFYLSPVYLFFSLSTPSKVSAWLSHFPMGLSKGPSFFLSSAEGFWSEDKRSLQDPAHCLSFT